MIERRIKAARFPAVKSLDSFDFKAIPSLNKMQVLELARCEWIERRENVIALGPSGTGKTHAALGLGLAACQKGLSVGSTTAAALVHELMEARDERRLLRLQKQMAGHKLLIIDGTRLRAPLQDRRRTTLRADQPALTLSRPRRKGATVSQTRIGVLLPQRAGFLACSVRSHPTCSMFLGIEIAFDDQSRGGQFGRGGGKNGNHAHGHPSDRRHGELRRPELIPGERHRDRRPGSGACAVSDADDLAQVLAGLAGLASVDQPPAARRASAGCVSNVVENGGRRNLRVPRPTSRPNPVGVGASASPAHSRPWCHFLFRCPSARSDPASRAARPRLVDLDAEPAHLALRNAAHPERLDEVVDRARRDALDTAVSAFSDIRRGSRKPGK